MSRRHSHDLKWSERGSGLIDVIVALGILGIAITAFMQYGKIILKNRNAAEYSRHRNLIKSMLLEATDCSKLPACVGNETRELSDKNDRLLINSQGTSTYGPWQVRAQCQANQTLEIRVASSQDGVVRKDPLTDQPLTWDNPHAVLIKSGFLCGKLSASLSEKKLDVMRSALCTRGKGTCPPPDLARRFPNAPKRMCCEDGRDIKRPQCPVGKKDIGAYWDREGDWGADGSWVVLCQ